MGTTMAAAAAQADSAGVGAQPSSWRGGGGSGRGERGWGPRNRAAAARVGRRDVDGGTQHSAQLELDEGEGKNG